MIHTAWDLGGLDQALRAEESQLEALQAERELAERIERGIKSLRSKTA